MAERPPSTLDMNKLPTERLQLTVPLLDQIIEGRLPTYLQIYL